MALGGCVVGRRCSCVCLCACFGRKELWLRPTALSVSPAPAGLVLPGRCCLRTQAEPLSRLAAVRNIKYHPKLQKNKHREVKKYNL